MQELSVGLPIRMSSLQQTASKAYVEKSPELPRFLNRVR